MTKSSTYRADIQGLRAIAVLLVLLFHFETRLKGGYLGVDMFFVISGFVIASSTLREIDHTNTFSWSAFLHRRIRRLLPGIAVVAVAASVLSMLLLSPFGPQQETAKMLLSAASYTSNFVLMPQSYFSLDPKANPLLHLWSLAVEEQFYFVWPIAIILLIGIRKRLPMRMFKPLVWVAVFGVVLASCWLFLVCSVNGSEVSGFLWFKPFIQWDITPEHFAFYSPFTRAWEFVAGVLAALLLRSKLVAFVHKTGPLIVFCGVALVLFGVAWASKFPEIQHDANWSTNTSATLVVVAGTMLWIIGGIRENFIRRFMSLRPFTLIGDCSYSIYLLHWPIWVLLITSFKQSNYLVGIAFSMSFILGWLQFRFVEEPIRSKSRIPSTKSLRFVGVFGVVASVGFVAMSLTTPVLGLYLAGIKPDEISLHITEKSCAGERYALDSAQSCVFGSTGKQGTAILVGDSMAKSLSDGFVKAANSQEMNAYVFLLPGCAYEMSDSPFSATNDCARWRADVLSALQQLQPKVVIIAQPPPQFAYDLRYNTSLLWPDPSKEPRDVVVARREGINEIEVNATTGIEYVVGVFNFDDIFCSAKFCNPQVENKFMFEEGDHLSVDGSLLVESKIRKQIRLALVK